MCILQPDHCAHHWIQISSTLPQQGQSHMDSEHLPTYSGHIQKTSKDSTTFSRMHKISRLSHYHFILLFTISSCVHYCSVLFPCVCLVFWVLCYYSLCQSYQHVLCIVHVLSLFVVVQFKYHVKRLELFKIRRYIMYPLYIYEPVPTRALSFFVLLVRVAS